MSTTKQTLSQTAWTQLSTGPVMIDAPMLTNVAVHFGQMPPDMTETAYHTLVGPTSLTYEGEQAAYARSLSAQGHVIFTAAAP